MPTDTAGVHTLTITATDNAGNVFVKTITYRVLDATNVDGNVNGSVPATLALTLTNPSATFGAFTAGLAKETATLVSFCALFVFMCLQPLAVSQARAHLW